MRVAVISEVELGSPRAHFINVIKTGGGFVRLGCETTVFCRPAADGAPAEAIARSMGEPDLRWSLAPAGLDVDAFAAWATEQAVRMGADLAYCRSFRAPIACASAGLTTAMETHAYIGDTNPDLCAALDATARPTNPIAALITISHRLAEHYVARGAAASRVHVVPDGVDVELFRRPAGAIPETPMSRWPGARVLYSGHLYDAKGIPTVIAAAGLIDGVTVHLLGGLDEDVQRARADADERCPGRVVVHGRIEHAAVPAWLWDADVLLLPPSANEPSKDWTSPVKLGEYLAAGAPIVASRIPALRDLLGDRDAFWFEPDDAEDLVRALRAALSERRDSRQHRRARAAELAEGFSYKRRARRIMDAAMGACVGNARA